MSSILGVIVLLFFLGKEKIQEVFVSKNTEQITSSSKSSSSIVEPQRVGTKSINIPISPSLADIKPSPNFPTPENHTVEQLVDFYLPSLFLEQVTLEEAIQALIDSYNEICIRTNHTPLHFKLTRPEDFSKRKNITIQGLNFQASLYSIAAQFSLKFELNQRKLVFTKISEKSSNTPLISQTFNLPIGLPTELRSILPDDRIAVKTDDTQHTIPSPLSSFELKKLFNKFGVNSHIDSQLNINKDFSILSITDSKENLKQIDNLIQVFGANQKNTKFQTKIIISPEELPLASGFSEKTNFPDVMRIASNIKGANVYSLPSILSDSNGGAITDIVESPNANGASKSELALEFRTERYGFGIQYQSSFESHNDAQTYSHQDVLSVAEQLGNDSFSQTDIAPGSHSLIDYSIDDSGQHRYIISSLTFLDSKGNETFLNNEFRTSINE